MHLLDAWSSLGPADLARLLAPLVAVVLAALLPGRGPARIAAVVVAGSVALLPELDAPVLVRMGWVALWLGVAWQAGAQDHAHAQPRSRLPRRAAVEAGFVALPLGLGLPLLLVAALSRQSLVPADARRASLGALLVGAGLLHLMLTRHIRRGMVAFAALGLGLELLAASARAADVLHAGPPAGIALAGAFAAIALTRRVAGGRERYAGSPLVGDAHELHD